MPNKSSPFRIGVEFERNIRQGSGVDCSTSVLQGLIADLTAENHELYAILKDLVGRQSFKVLLPLAGTGTGRLEKDALIQEINRVYLPAVCYQVSQFLDGFLGLGSQFSVQGSAADGGAENHKSLASSSKPRLWLRFLVRSCDMGLFGFLLGILFELIAPGKLQIYSQKYPPMVLDIAILPIYFLGEALSLKVFGTTLFKKFLKIRISKADLSKISFKDAFARSFKVYTLGLGMGFPIISFIFQYVSARRLSTTGYTAWDAGKFAVIHENPGKYRIIALAFIWLIFAIASVYATLIGLL